MEADGVPKYCQPTEAQKKELCEKFRKETNYLLPRSVSLDDLYTLTLVMRAGLPCYVPPMPNKKEIEKSGFEVDGKDYKHTVGRKKKKYCHLIRVGIQEFLSEYIGSTFRLAFWAEKVQTDYDYILLVLFIVNPDFYLKLRNNELTMRPTSLLGKTRAFIKIDKRFSSLESDITNGLFQLISIDTSIKDEKREIDQLCVDVCNSCEGFLKTEVLHDDEWNQVVANWYNIAKDWRIQGKDETSETFFEAIFNAHQGEFKKDRIMLTPGPFSEQECNKEHLLEISRLIESSIGINKTSRKRLYHIPQDYESSESDEEEDPADLKVFKNKLKESQSKLRPLDKDTVMEMLDSYWVFCKKSQSLIPNTTHPKLKIPEIHSTSLGNLMEMLNANFSGGNKGRARIPSIPSIELKIEKIDDPILNELNELLKRVSSNQAKRVTNQFLEMVQKQLSTLPDDLFRNVKNFQDIDTVMLRNNNIEEILEQSYLDVLDSIKDEFVQDGIASSLPMANRILRNQMNLFEVKREVWMRYYAYIHLIFFHFTID
jgi:hypothetical protein